MLSADAQLDIGTGLAAQFGSHFNQLAYALLVKTGKGIKLVYLLGIVIIQELTGVIAAEAEGHLGKVVGAEGEEFSLLRNLVGQQQLLVELRSWFLPCIPF